MVFDKMVYGFFVNGVRWGWILCFGVCWCGWWFIVCVCVVASG